jgi:hypothetical protein
VTTARAPVPFAVPAADVPVDDLLALLAQAGVLNALGIENHDLIEAGGDPDLIETLRITYEPLVTLKDAGLLDTFFQLPIGNQADFLRWIGMTDDADVRRRRTRTFVLALRESPLSPMPEQ